MIISLLRCCAVVLLFAVTSFAQIFSANLSGLVLDGNGAAIPAASVRLRNINTNDARQTTSGTDGRYTVSQLPPGAYELTVEQTGFKKYIAPKIELQASQTAEFNVNMTVGDVKESIEVSASAPILDTQTANKAVTLTTREVLELPVNARNPLVFVQDTAGVNSVRTGISTATTDQNHNRFALNGGRDESAAILVDGAAATAVDWGGALAMPNVDAVAEVQVVRNTFDVQYGKTDGGVVNIVTKGGTNSFHGSAYEFLRNDHLDANSWTNNRNGIRKTTFQRNQFGGTLGGPIWKSKRLYFYGGYEGLRQGSPSNLIASVPTLLQRQGDFSQTFNANGTLAVIYDPATTRPNPDGPGFIRDAFPGNRIPSNRFDAVGLKVLNLFPQPNLPGDPVVFTRNFASGGKGTSINDRMDARVDWAKSERYSFFTRVTKAWQKSTVPTFFGNGADSNFGDMNPRHQIVIGNTILPNPTWVINVLIGSGRWREVQISPSQGMNATAIGLPASLVSTFSALTIPQITFTNYQQIGNSRYLDYPRENHNLSVNVTKELSGHSLKFGFYGELGRLHSTDVNSANFSFTRGLTSGPVAATDSTASGNAIASLLLGTGASGAAPTNARLALKQFYYGWYLQDTWRISRRLTINAGLRYEIQLGRTERYNRMNYFDMNATNPLSQATGLNLKGGLHFVEPGQGLWDTSYKDFAPRIGLSYKLTDRVVFRSGYGIYYPPTAAVSNATADGFSTSTQWVSTQGGGGIIPQNPLSNPFPQGLVQPVGSTQGLSTLVGNNISAFQRYHPSAYVQSYSADIQWEFKSGGVIEIGYSGTQSRKLLLGVTRNINALDPKYFSQGAALNDPVPNPFFGVITAGALAGATVPRYQLLRPYPQFLNVNLSGDTPGASASFNALTFKYAQRFAKGLNTIITYQWSKAIDNTSETQAWEISDAIRNPYDMHVDRSISGHDLPQSFVATAVYEIPVGKGKSFGSNLPKALDLVAGGWQVSGVARFASGLPLQITQPNTLSNYGYAVARPNIADLKALDVPNQTPDQWFNTGAVTRSPDFTIGNAPRWLPNLRYGPTKHADIALSKNFRFFESLRTQFRAEAFNITNTPQFGRANTNVGDGAFGKVTGTTNVGARNIQLALRFDF